MTYRPPTSPRVLTLALFYLALTFVFAGELLIPGRSLFRWDTLIYTWPMVQEARAQILAGHWPFWASSFLCGTPLLENINAGVFYPMKLIVYFLPLQFGYQLFLFVHVWLTFLFTHLFLQRGLKLRATAALIGALAFGASGYMRSMWDTHNFYAFPWIPLALWAAIADTTPRRRILGLAFCFVMLIYGGDLEHAILTVPAILLIVLLKGRSEQKDAKAAKVSDLELSAVIEPARKPFALFATFCLVLLGIGIGLLLSAPQLLPAWDWSHYSYRAAGMPIAEAAERSFNPKRLIELIIPYFYGTRDGWNGAHLAYGTKTTPWCASFHIGLVPFLLALVGVVAFLRNAGGSQNRRYTLWALALFVGGVLLAIGGFIEPLFRLVHSLPLLGSFRYPEKYLLWATLGLATLAATGADAFLKSLIVAGGVDPGSSNVDPRAGRGQRPRLQLPFPRLTLAALAFISVLLPWYKELPTTSRFNPLDTPQFLIPILASDDPQGRIFVDPAVKNVPLPPDYATLRPSEREAIYLRESLAFNSPRLWGCRTAGGFSPAESFASKQSRSFAATNAVDAATSIGAHWIVSSIKSLPDFGKMEWEERSPVIRSWGNPPELVVRRLDARDAEPLRTNAVAIRPKPLIVWRPGPNSIRVDSPVTLHSVDILEGGAPGWRDSLSNGHGNPRHVFISIGWKSDGLQMRLNYEPLLWRQSLWVALAGVVMALGIGFVGRGKIPAVGSVEGGKFQWLEKSRWVVLVSCAVFVVVSVASRSHWSATFDEGFHLTRGLALRHFGDARLSYFHPPLQNALGGYFADLAFGDRLKYPVTPALQRGDALTYATEFARANGDVFNEAVRASRWGSMLFGLLLVAVGVWWARRIAGPLAGWLAGIALALNPNLIAHGNLDTTDMGVTALVVAGTAVLWRAVRYRSLASLAEAAAVFVLASMTKYTGLIWLGTTLLLVVPLLAWRWRNARVLLVMPLGVLALLALITFFYGSPTRFVAGLSAQTLHSFEGHKAWFHGQLFEQSSWWHLPAAIILKSPEVWLAAAGLVAVTLLRKFAKRQTLGTLIVLLSATVFAVLLFFVNNMAIGVRHALPLVALGSVAGAVAIALLSNERVRKLLAAVYAGGMVVAAGSSFPNYIAYFPTWAGGTEDGCRWLVDSNFDWGQGLDELEEQWAALTVENEGEPPNLVYYGFSDPRVTHKLRVGPNSYCGFMDAAGSTNVANRLLGAKGLAVVSISAPALRPHGLDLTPLADAQFVRRLGSFEVFQIPRQHSSH